MKVGKVFEGIEDKKETVLSEIDIYEREFKKWSEIIKEKEGVLLRKIINLKQGIDTKAPDKIVEDGIGFLDLLDFFDFALKEIELLRKDLHDYIDNKTSIFEITLKSEWEKRNANGEKIKITDKALNREALANNELFKLKMLYNKFEVLSSYTARQINLIQETINLIKKLGTVRSEYLKSLGEEV